MSDVFTEARGLLKAGDAAAARAVLRRALRIGMDAADTERAGRLLLKAPVPGPRVRVLGVCTTAWIPPVLTAVAWGRGVALSVTDGDYDSILQEIDAGEVPDVMVLLPWTQRLYVGDDPAAAVAGEVAFWESAWGRLRGAKLAMVGYDYTSAGPAGVAQSGAPGGQVDRVRAVNAALRARLPVGAAWVDLEQIAGDAGRRQFYDPRRYHWTKQPFSEGGNLELCRHLFAAVRAVTTGPKKLVVCDLDNTLWGGVVGETGANGIAIRETPDGEAHRALQKHLLGLTRRGVLLAVCSKNNPADAEEPFASNGDMVLRREHFAAFEASWDPKPAAIARIAATLRLGLDSFVFLDDNPAERKAVRQALPDVEVVELPDDPAGYVQALEAGLWFETAALTAADTARAGQYQAEAARRNAESSYTDLGGYLRSLEMKAQTRRVDEADVERVVQLLGKTNQFNLTTRRHGAEAVRGWVEDPRAVPLTLRLADKFGDHGLVAVVVGVPEDEGLRIDTWLMSCRVIGRTLEHYTLAQVAEAARAAGHTRLLGEYLPTPKNQQVADLYDRLGFELVEEGADGRRVYAVDVERVIGVETFVE